MTAQPPRPKLALVYDRASITPLELAEAARPVCDLIWVAELEDPALGPLLPLLRRLGSVIDCSGLTDDETAERLSDHPPQGVITFAERQIPLASAIAQRYGLPYFSPATADLLSNKYRQRMALARAGVPGPAFWPVFAGAALAERERLAAELSYPVVLKPQEGRGSRDTSLVEGAPQLLGLLDELAAEDMLIEELLPEAHPREDQRFGETLMVDTLLADGRVTHFSVCGHFIPASPFRGAGSFTPSHFHEDEMAAILAATDAAVAALGIDRGFTNTDLIMTPSGPRVLEVNGRLGGEVHTLREMAGAPPMLSEPFRFAVGVAGEEIPSLHSGPVAFCANYHAPMHARRLLTIEGLDVAGALPGVTRIVSYRHPGDEVDWRVGTMSRIFTMYGVVADHDELEHTHAQMERAVTTTYEYVSA